MGSKTTAGCRTSSTSSTTLAKVTSRIDKTRTLTRRRSDGDPARRDLTESFEDVGDEDDELMSEETHRRERQADPPPEPRAREDGAPQEAASSDSGG